MFWHQRHINDSHHHRYQQAMVYVTKSKKTTNSASSLYAHKRIYTNIIPTLLPPPINTCGSNHRTRSSIVIVKPQAIHIQYTPTQVDNIARSIRSMHVTAQTLCFSIILFLLLNFSDISTNTHICIYTAS